MSTFFASDGIAALERNARVAVATEVIDSGAFDASDEALIAANDGDGACGDLVLLTRHG